MKESKEMGKLLQFKKKTKNDNGIAHLLSEIEYTKTIFLNKNLGNVLVIINGGELGKACTSNGVNTADAKEMCRDFIRNAKEYIED